VQGGSQRLSSALARAVKLAGGDVLVRRVVSDIALDAQGRAGTITHTIRGVDNFSASSATEYTPVVLSSLANASTAAVSWS